MTFFYLIVDLVMCQKARNYNNSDWEVAAVSSKVCISSVVLSGKRSYWVNALIELLFSVFRMYITLGSVLNLRICCFSLSLCTGSLKKR